MLFFVFWIGDILAVDALTDFEPHIFQLLFFAATVVAVACGIWITTRLLPPRGSMWLVVLALGGRWGSEGDVALTGSWLGLAVMGLILMVLGLTAAGVETMRRRS